VESFEKIAKKVDKFNSKRSNTQKDLSSELFLRGVTEISSGVIAGIALGFFLDSAFKTNFIFMLICMFLGFIGAMLNIYKQMKERR